MISRKISAKRATSWRRIASSPKHSASTSWRSSSPPSDSSGRSTSPRCRSGSWITISQSTDARSPGAIVRSVPLGLTVLRLLLAPVLVWMVYAGAPGILFAGVILVAFVSDYFDGVIARRLGVATPELRHFDSRADLVFYATAAWAVWMLRPDVARSIAVA